MEIKTYRARSLQEALQWIRSDLGPEAAVLHTRELRGGWMGLLGPRELEVTAGLGVEVPSRLSRDDGRGNSGGDEVMLGRRKAAAGRPTPPAHASSYRARYRQALRHADESPSLVEELCLRAGESARYELPDTLAALFHELAEADFDERSARDLIERLRDGLSPIELDEPAMAKQRLASLIAQELKCVGSIQATPGQRRVVAFVGATGVGKTTTIAKLAADFQLSQRKSVGLITVDTYRVAAIDQLRTYANILDLPMEVVAGPHEMRTALAKLAAREVVLVDTSGHGSGDEYRIQELKSLVQVAGADEVHAVASAASSASSLEQLIERFAAMGATRLILTKLDEAARMGHLWPVLRRRTLSLSYVTHGQNVPADFAPAEPRELAGRLLGWDVAR
jgi:flagellar biosynthesis protein FlhF